MKAEARGQSVTAVLSSIGAWLVPVGVCPVCWAAYAGAASSLGLGFTLSSEFLAPLAAMLLTLSLVALGYRAPDRHGYGPFVLGAAGALGVLGGKLWLSSEALSYVALAAIVTAGVWNSWPVRSAPTSCAGACPVTEE